MSSSPQPDDVAARGRNGQAVECQPFTLGNPADVATTSGVGGPLDVDIDVGVVGTGATRVARGGIVRGVETLRLIGDGVRTCRDEQARDETAE